MIKGSWEVNTPETRRACPEAHLSRLQDHIHEGAFLAVSHHLVQRQHIGAFASRHGVGLRPGLGRRWREHPPPLPPLRGKKGTATARSGNKKEGKARSEMFGCCLRAKQPRRKLCFQVGRPWSVSDDAPPPPPSPDRNTTTVLRPVDDKKQSFVCV